MQRSVRLLDEAIDRMRLEQSKTPEMEAEMEALLNERSHGPETENEASNTQNFERPSNQDNLTVSTFEKEAVQIAPVVKSAELAVTPTKFTNNVGASPAPSSVGKTNRSLSNRDRAREPPLRGAKLAKMGVRKYQRLLNDVLLQPWKLLPSEIANRAKSLFMEPCGYDDPRQPEAFLRLYMLSLSNDQLEPFFDTTEEEQERMLRKWERKSRKLRSQISSLHSSGFVDANVSVPKKSRNHSEIIGGEEIALLSLSDTDGVTKKKSKSEGGLHRVSGKYREPLRKSAHTDWFQELETKLMQLLTDSAENSSELYVELPSAFRRLVARGMSEFYGLTCTTVTAETSVILEESTVLSVFRRSKASLREPVRLSEILLCS